MAFVTSGKINSGNKFHEFAAATFVEGGVYEWQVRTWDAAGAEGPWSTLRTFTAVTPSNVSARVGGAWVQSNRYVYSGGTWVRHNPSKM